MPTVLVKSLSANEKDQEFVVDEGGLLFDQLENQGCTLPHGCLAGSCGSCRIEILDGSQNLSSPGAVEKDTIAALSLQHPNAIIRLACRARVLSDVTIKVLKK